MARTYRDIAIEEMLETVEEAMSQAINWWGDLPPPMKEAIEQFRTEIGAAIERVDFVKGRSTEKYTKIAGKARANLRGRRTPAALKAALMAAPAIADTSRSALPVTS